jgi:hypothetical protein
MAMAECKFEQCIELKAQEWSHAVVNEEESRHKESAW